MNDRIRDAMLTIKSELAKEGIEATVSVHGHATNEHSRFLTEEAAWEVALSLGGHFKLDSRNGVHWVKMMDYPGEITLFYDGEVVVDGRKAEDSGTDIPQSNKTQRVAQVCR